MRTTKRDYFESILRAVGTRSTCDRGRNAAIIVRDGRILATGYAGSPPGEPHCDDVGHSLMGYVDIGGKKINTETNPPVGVISSLHCIRTTHAEMNALFQCARYGTPVEGSMIFTTMFPCLNCARAIVSVGIVAVLSLEEYQTGDDSKSLFNRHGIRFDVGKESWILG